jgi:hypothetical protein
LSRLRPLLIAAILLATLPIPTSPITERAAAVDLQQLPPVADPDDRWGINHTYADPVSQRLALNAGARWNRWEFRWAEIELSRGQFRYPAFDRMVDASQATGLQVQGILISTPDWAKDPQTQLPQGLYLPWNDNGNLWGRFVRETVSRYRGRIRHWEAWNEPDLREVFWPGSIGDYYQLLKVTYLSVKSVDPGAQVLMAGLAYWPNPNFLDEMLRFMRADPIAPTNNYFFDILAWHTYSRPSDSFDRVVQSRAQLGATVGQKPIWINETNIPAWNESAMNNFRPYRWSATIQEQAAYIIQAAAYAIASGAQRVFVYRLQDTEWPEAYGLVRTNGTLRPAYTAFQLVSRYFSRISSAQVAQQGDVQQIVLRRGNERLNVVWNRSSRAQTVRVGAGATSATVVDQGGATRSIRATAGQFELELPPATANNGLDANDYMIGGSPFILVESPPSGLQTIEESSSLIGFAGQWDTQTAAGPSGGAYRRHGGPGFSAAVEFDGQTITWVTAKGSDRGFARVEVDGQLIAEIDLYSPTPTWQVPLTFGEFREGQHRMVITVLSQRNGASTGNFIDVDALIASGFRQATAPPTPTPLPTPTATPSPTPTVTPTGVRTATPVPTPPPGRAQAAAHGAVSDPATRLVLPIVMRARNGWTTPLSVQNRGSAPSVVTATFFDEAGAPVGTHTVSLAMDGSDVIDPRAVPALRDGFVGSALLESPQPIAASVREVRAESDALGYTGAATGGERAYAPLLFKRYNGWDTGLQVQNLGDQAVPVTVTYRQTNAEGGPWREQAVVPARAAVTFYQPANEELPAGFVGSAVVDAPPGSRIVSVINEVHDGGSGMSYDGALRGSPVASAPLLFRNSNGWSTGLQIQNVGVEESEVLVVYSASDGSGRWYDGAFVQPGSSVTFFQPAHPELPNGFIGSAVIISRNDQPLVAIVNEVNTTLNVAMTYRAFNEGAPTLSVPYLARRADGWSTGVQVQNLGSAASTVALQIRAPDGSLVVTPSQSVPPGDSRTFYLPAIEGVNDGWRGSGVITSSPPQPLGAIINETHY